MSRYRIRIVRDSCCVRFVRWTPISCDGQECRELIGCGGKAQPAGVSTRKAEGGCSRRRLGTARWWSDIRKAAGGYARCRGLGTRDGCGVKNSDHSLTVVMKWRERRVNLRSIG